MDTEPFTLEEVERIDTRWTDEFARNREWEKLDFSDPEIELAAFLEKLPGQSILDAGCGWARYIHYFLDAGLDYHGLDHSEEMLTYARQSYPDEKFFLGSVTTLPFPDQRFDGVWSCCVLTAVPKRHITRVLAEHRRVLKPNGIIAILMPWFRYSCDEMTLDDDGKPLYYTAIHVPEEFASYIAEAGFTVIDTMLNPSANGFMVLARR